jgi:hypothetical protein
LDKFIPPKSPLDSSQGPRDSVIDKAKDILIRFVQLFPLSPPPPPPSQQELNVISQLLVDIIDVMVVHNETVFPIKDAINIFYRLIQIWRIPPPQNAKLLLRLLSINGIIPIMEKPFWIDIIKNIRSIAMTGPQSE